MTDACAQRPLSRAAPLVIGAALFVQSLDTHALTAILPAVARALDASPIELNLAVSAYFVGAAVFLPLSGWTADRFGARRVFQVAIVGFVVGSLLCGVARNVTELALTRAAMGAATAGLMPVGRLILIRVSERAELVRQFAYLAMFPMMGPLVGPLVAGAFATYGSWRWIFLLNVPIGLIGCLLVGRFVPSLPGERAERLDTTSAVLLGAGLASGVLVLERVGRSGVAGALEAGLALLCLFSLLAYARHSARTPRPILDLSLFRFPTFRAGVIGGFFYRLSVGAEPFLLALLFQVGLGMSAFVSGALVSITAVGTLLMRATSPAVIRHLGFKRLMALNVAASAVIGAAPAFFTGSTPLAAIVLVLFVRGFLRSLQLTTMNVVTYADVPDRAASAASSLAATVQQMTHGLSVVLAAAIVAATAGSLDLSRGAIAPAFFIVSALSLVSLIDVLRLPPHAGAEISGHRAARLSSAGDGKR